MIKAALFLVSTVLLSTSSFANNDNLERQIGRKIQRLEVEARSGALRSLTDRQLMILNSQLDSAIATLEGNPRIPAPRPVARPLPPVRVQAKLKLAECSISFSSNSFRSHHFEKSKTVDLNDPNLSYLKELLVKETVSACEEEISKQYFHGSKSHRAGMRDCRSPSKLSCNI